MLQLRVSPILTHRNAVDGLRSIAVKQGRGVFAQAEEIAGVFGSCLGSGSDDIGVRGENEWDDSAGKGNGQGVGVLGTVKLELGVGVRGENTASATPSSGSAIAVLGNSLVGTGVQGISNGQAGGAVRRRRSCKRWKLRDRCPWSGEWHCQCRGEAELDVGTAIKAMISPGGVGGVFDATKNGLPLERPAGARRRFRL